MAEEKGKQETKEPVETKGGKPGLPEQVGPYPVSFFHAFLLAFLLVFSLFPLYSFPFFHHFRCVTFLSLLFIP